MKNVQDIYPVTPMQEFMLLHGLGQNRYDTLFNQFVFGVESELSTEAFAAAWGQVLEAHTALRTAFIWQGVDTPQQVVRQAVELECQTLDHSSLDDHQQVEELQLFLNQDRQRGFDFRRAPLMRFGLIKQQPNRWRVIWSSHHLVVDRWCIDQLIDEFQQYYRAHLDGIPLPTRRAPSYRDYVAWLHQQDDAAAKEHWKRYLHGFRRPIDTGKLLASVEEGDSGSSAALELDAGLTASLRALGARANVTLSCVVQAGLGIALNTLSGHSDVLFGMTVAGRPAALAHVESIVGSFISTLPVRIPFVGNTPVIDWLRELNAAQFANAGRDYLSPAQFRQCANLPSDRALFDVLMVWLAQTRVEDQAAKTAQALPLLPQSEQYATAYPLTLSVIERADQLTLRIDTQPGQTGRLGHFLDTLQTSLETLARCDEQSALSDVEHVTVRSEHAEQSDHLASTEPTPFKAEPVAGVIKRGGREDVQLDAMHDLIRGEWQAVLSLPQSPGLDEDFFNLGGDSLKAASLHTRLEAATRKAIPLLALFEDSTLDGMSRTLINEKWPLRDGIAVPLRTSGARSPLFCVASPEVNTLGYAMLTRHLPERRNLVLLQAPPAGDDLEQLHPDELSQLAASYVEALRAVQPTGPYSLLSMCSGAHVAFYMIRQLEQAGERVQFAGVINTWSMYSVSWRFYVNRFINVAGYYTQRVRQLIQSRVPRVVAEPALAAQPSSAKDDSAPLPGKVVPAESAVGLDNPWIRRVGFARLLPAGLRIQTPVSVFRLDAQPYWRTGGAALGWSRLSASTRIIRVEGDDHDAILREPFVQKIALQLDAELERSSGPSEAG